MAKPVTAKNLSQNAFTRNLADPASCSFKLSARLYQTPYPKIEIIYEKNKFLFDHNINIVHAFLRMQ